MCSRSPTICWPPANVWSTWNGVATTRFTSTRWAARRIPDPTTAGDFCRRFSAHDIDALQDVFNHTRLKIWRQQPAEFFKEAVLDADGKMVETTAARRMKSESIC